MWLCDCIERIAVHVSFSLQKVPLCLVCVMCKLLCPLCPAHPAHAQPQPPAPAPAARRTRMRTREHSLISANSGDVAGTLPWHTPPRNTIIEYGFISRPSRVCARVKYPPRRQRAELAEMRECSRVRMRVRRAAGAGGGGCALRLGRGRDTQRTKRNLQHYRQDRVDFL